MTREEAISIMKVIVHMLEEKYDTDRVEEAVDMAIKTLEQKPICEDCISRERMLKYFEGWKNQIKYYHPYAKNFDIPYEEAIQWVKDMPPVNPQKAICPSTGVDCEDCPAYEKKSECEHDHEILKAYSDGASAVLDNVRAEIEERKLNSGGEPNRELAFNVCLQIIDGYMTEEDKV